MGLQVDIMKVFEDNAEKNGPDIQRKNNFIINAGDNMTAQDREKRINQNIAKYGLSSDYIKNLHLPKIEYAQK